MGLIEILGLLRRSAVLACVAVAIGTAGASAADTPIKDFFDVEAVPVNQELASERFRTCPRPPPAVVDHTDVVFYTDEANSVVSPELWRQRMSLNRPLRDFSSVVTRLADHYLQSPSRNAARASCVARWIEAWAQQGAFLGNVTTWARYDTLWFGQVQLAVAYLKVRSDSAITPQTHATIRQWLGDVARAAITDQNQAQFEGKLTNIRAWTAAAAAVAAVAADDRELFDYSVATARAILGTVTADGALPAELERRGRAFNYHVWALEPLALVALIAERNGVPLAGEHDHALRRVVDFILEAHRDRSTIERLAGAPQDGTVNQWPRPWELGAFEIFRAIEPHDGIDELLQRRLPVVSPFSGGDWTRTLGRQVN